MTHDLNKVQAIQHRVIALRDRIAAAVGNAKSHEWPHDTLSSTARLYVEETEGAVQFLLTQASTQLALLSPQIQEPISDLHTLHLDVRFGTIAERLGISQEAVSEAAFAVCDRYLDMASGVVAHVEAFIAGDQTITGEVITHEPLCEK